MKKLISLALAAAMAASLTACGGALQKQQQPQLKQRLRLRQGRQLTLQ